jgi:hypothetical protein
MGAVIRTEARKLAQKQKRKEMTMKSINILGRLTGLSLAILFSLALTTAVSAGDTPTAKGGAKLLMKPQPAVAETSSHAMACPLCKDEFSTRKDTTARGMTKPTVIVARHLCPSCETKLSATGHGKAKQDVVTHRCTAGSTQTSTCCAMN